MMQIPDKLKERLEKLGISNVYEERTRKCILSRQPLPLERVPWYENAYFIADNFEKKDEFIFDPVSLVPCLALGPQKQDKILDMCAAPGTKTFILSFLTDNESHITSNDINPNRVRRLKSIVNKYGLSAEVTNKSGRRIEGSFNKILLDAPCSGEGMVNKKEKAFSHWSEKRSRSLAKKQKKLLLHAFELLEPRGVLVYSTCTFAPEENEMVVDALLEKKDAEINETGVKINHSPGLAEWCGKEFDKSLEKCMRIYPHHNKTGGFFVCRITKK